MVKYIKTKALVLSILVGIIFFTCLQYVNAETQIQTLGGVKQGDTINLTQNCLSSSYSNISRIVYPNRTFIINSQTPMIKTGDDYSYSFSNTSTIGNYIVYGVCDESGAKTNWVYDFNVTPNGDTLSTGSSIIFSILTIFVFLFFLMGLFFSIAIPYGNKIKNDGAVIKVSKLKYVKIAVIMITYLSFIWVLNLLIALSNNYSFLTQYYGLVSFLFTALNSIALPFGLGLLILSFFEIIRDANIQKQIESFGSALR